MSEMIIYRGVPASGKTTAALQYLESVVNTARVNRDDIRKTMFGAFSGVDETVVTEVENAMVESALRAGQNVLLDATNLNAKFLKTKFSLASRYGATVTFVDFPVTLEEAKFRDMNREKKVGRKVLEGFFTRYKINPDTGILPKHPEPLPEFHPYTTDLTKTMAYIVDTDGTVANSDGVRNPYDTSKYSLDTVNGHVASVVNALVDTGYTIVALSGRDEEFRDVTERWWWNNGIQFEEFLMRPKGDKRMDAIVKYELFKKYIEPNYNVLGAFDDRPQVIRMWRTIGVPVFDVGHGVEF